MLLRCCGSSSAGNSYALISNSGEILAIEAGCKFLDFKKMIGRNKQAKHIYNTPGSDSYNPNYSSTMSQIKSKK